MTDKKTKIIESNPVEDINTKYSNSKHTVIGGLNTGKKEESGNLSLANDERKIVGFLTSYSHLEKGEYWLLKLGKNRIGKGEDCEIILKEASISDVHAILIVRKSQKDEKLMFTLKDNMSTNGTFVNDEDIEYEPKGCNHGDVLKVGEYELLMFCIDTEKLGLASNPSFQSIKVEKKTKNQPLYDYSARNPDKTRIINPE